MFESAEIGHKLGKAEFRREEPKLRERLLALQYRLLDRGGFPVIILVNGVDGAGKGETVNLLNEWMDPRHIHTHAFGELTQGERERPEMWRFWKALPPKGRIGILFGSWYTDPILKRVMGHEKRAEFQRRLERIRHFERMLVSEGAVLLKNTGLLPLDVARSGKIAVIGPNAKSAQIMGGGSAQLNPHYMISP
ncbi:MAG TPA: glycoside hydrolase family 3 C-terminal domain-containing protein, partial [Usitatibacter sp.]|nr:glycoside hydrolase family 3 C-terminal domain-containing protein [Usitatibacter sp.]